MAASPVTSPDITPRNWADGEPKSGFQKRIDRLIRQRKELEAENVVLRADLQRALSIIEKFQKVLRKKKEEVRHA